MKNRRGLWTALGLAALIALPAAAEKQRTIVFNEDRAQHYMTTKVYELKHAGAHDLLPYVTGAVKRFDSQSTVQSLDYRVGGKQYLVVSTSPEMLKYVDNMIAMLDYPAKKIDASGAIIEGDGITRYAYCSKFRAAEDMLKMTEQTFAPGGFGSGYAAFDRPTNMFFWKSSKSQADEFMKMLTALDRPVPQLQIELKVYTVADNYFRELGVDYVGWKNGPGAELFSTGFDFSNFYSSQNIENFVNLLSDGPAWDATGMGMLMVAPNFDATFLRMLAQKGRAAVASTAALTVVNDFAAVDTFDDAKYRFRFTPQFQRIVKDGENQKTTVEETDNTELSFFLSAPMICFGDDPGKGAATLMCTWNLETATLVENDNLGNPTTDLHKFSSWLTIGVDTEKLLASFDKEVKVKQYNGMPFFGDIPVLKYILGSESVVKSKVRVFVTMTVKPVVTANALPKNLATATADAK